MWILILTPGVVSPFCPFNPGSPFVPNVPGWPWNNYTEMLNF